jgi:hypothetical protein
MSNTCEGQRLAAQHMSDDVCVQGIQITKSPCSYLLSLPTLKLTSSMSANVSSSPLSVASKRIASMCSIASPHHPTYRNTKVAKRNMTVGGDYRYAGCCDSTDDACGHSTNYQQSSVNPVPMTNGKFRTQSSHNEECHYIAPQQGIPAANEQTMSK